MENWITSGAVAKKESLGNSRLKICSSGGTANCISGKGCIITQFIQRRGESFLYQMRADVYTMLIIYY